MQFPGGQQPLPGRNLRQLRRSDSGSNSWNSTRVPSANSFWICAGCDREFERRENLVQHQRRSKLCSNHGWAQHQSKRPTFSSADQYKGGGVLNEIESYIPGMMLVSGLLVFDACFWVACLGFRV